MKDNKNKELHNDKLEQVAGGIDPTKENVNGPAYTMKEKMGDRFNRGWLYDWQWSGDLVSALVEVYGAEAANDIVRSGIRPCSFFGVNKITRRDYGEII